MKFKNIIKTEQEYKSLKKACDISVSILRTLRDSVKAGVSALDIDALADELIKRSNSKAAFKGVMQYTAREPFNYSVCVSINDEILHGMPNPKVIKNGDVVKLDFGIIHDGFYTDHCVCIGVGNITPQDQKLIDTARLCIQTAIPQAVVGNEIADISRALQTVAELAGFDYVRSYCGHGVGKALWMEPEIPSYVNLLKPRIALEDGMVLSIENQITVGSADLKIDSDGWTLRTKDGSRGAMFEHMVIVRKNKPEVLTVLD